MNVQLLAFTERGFALAERLAAALGGQAARCGAPLSLADWTARAFSSADGLIFVGAAGIAVRAVAPHVNRKDSDPAVVVVDELGRFAVPILSGHLGGANDLARRIARLIGAIPVITTATDLNDVFAVDEWAKRQGCAVAEPERIKQVSGKLLAGDAVTFRSPWPIAGAPPQGVELARGEEWDFSLTLGPDGRETLHLVPKIVVLGVGCRRGTPQETLERAYQEFLTQHRLYPQAVAKVCTIDLKGDEPGLLAFCQAHGLSLQTFSAQQLGQVQGEFTPSAFVTQVTGVDNVCERSAVLGSGGTLYVNKTAGNGVTMAAALAPFAPDWRWQYE